MNKIRSCLFALLFAIPVPVFAVDGDFVAASSAQGVRISTLEWLLCDGAIGACSQFDFLTALNGPGTMPDYYVIEMRAEDCSSTEPVFTLQGHATSGGMAHVYSAVFGTGGGGVTSVTVDPGRHRYISATNTAGSGGCADVEAVVRAFYRF